MSEINILVVDDNSERASKLREALSCEMGVNRVELAGSSAEARALLYSNHYDLLVLDVSLPKFRDTSAEREEGAWLLREIQESGALNRPTHIVGITAYRDLHAASNAAFDNSFARLIFTDVSNDWSAKIVDFVRHLVSSQRANKSVVDVAIVTALWSPEFEAVLSSDLKLVEGLPLDDSTRLWFGEVEGVRVAAGCALRMGPVSAAILSTKIIMSLRPKLILLVGICAGVKGEVALGDVVVSTDVLIWDAGKLTDGGGFSPSPVSLPVRESLVSALRGDELPRRAIDFWNGYGGSKPAALPVVHFGPVASGSSVIADEAVVENIRSHNRKVIAVDMEAFAVHSACAASSHPQPGVLTVKSICDFADKDKNSSIQSYTAGVSAALIVPILRLTTIKGGKGDGG